MGLIKAAKDAIGSMMADQWREYFYCDALPDGELIAKGRKRVNAGRNSNTKGQDNIITDGSIVAVNEGQCMMIVEQGGIVEFCAEAGEFVFDASTEPTVFYGDLDKTVADTFAAMAKRFTFGGNTAKDQRVYFFNTKENFGNLFGTASPIPFRVVDDTCFLNMDVSLRCNGEYSFRLADPILFYKNVCGNVPENFDRSRMMSQMKAELLTALQPAFARISAMGIFYSAIPAHTLELAQALNEELSATWKELRGIEIVSMSINSIKASEEDEKIIQEAQREAQKNRMLNDPGRAAAHLVGAQAEAMKGAANNTATGPIMAFAGMNMAAQAGGFNANQLFQMSAGNPAGGAQGSAGQSTGNPAAASGQGGQAPVPGWTCSCGKTDNRGRFCAECGKKKPEEAGWTCSCGAVNQGKFCVECGAPRPQGAPIYRCDKCGWEPEDPAHPPKFCPECGDPFDESDRA